MDSLKSILKLGLATALVVFLVVFAFLIGYQTGNRTEESGTSADVVVIDPTATAINTTAPVVTEATPVTPSPLADTASPTSTSVPHSPSPEPVTPTSTQAQESEPGSPGSVQPEEPTREPTLTDEEAMAVLDEVWNLIEEEFYGELPNPEERAYGAIRGMLGTLDDDYTSFSEPSIAEIRRIDATGSFEGIGAHVTMNEEDILEIVQTFEDSPAEDAGLLSGDKVLAVDGQSIIGFGIFDAITLIRGPEGTEVTLTVQRGDAEPFDVTIVRARLDIPVVESEMLEGDIGYVSLFEFSSPATQRLETAIQELLEEGATSLILDLRSNPGGFLDQAIRVSDLFLDDGLVLIERRSGGQEQEFTSTDDGLAQDLPLVVLVDGSSASASEIVAGAIQDRDRGVLIGQQTFGKGSVQLLHTLSDGSELRVTVARWFTPNDRAIHGEGLVPDIEVELTAEDLEADQDPQLDAAIEFLRTGQ